MENSLSAARKRLWVLVILIVATSWYPLALDAPTRIENTASRLPDGTWELDRRSLVISHTSDPATAILNQGSFRLTVAASRAIAEQSGPARLFSTGRSPWDAAFMIGIDGGNVVVRLPCGGVASGADAEWKVPFDSTGDVELTLRFDGGATDDGLYLQVANGAWQQLRNNCPNGTSPRLPNATEYLALGNVHSGHRPFVGRIHKLELADGKRSVDLLRETPWEAPPTYWLWPERLYEPSDNYGTEVLSALWHFLSFAALGYLLGAQGLALGTRGTLAIAVAFAAILTGGKLLIASRHPSFMDIVV